MTEHAEVTVGAQGCNAQSSWNGNHEIKYCARPVGHPGEHRSSLVSEWDTLKWRDDDDPVPASQSVPAVPVSSTGGKEAGEAAETATEALRDALADLLDAAMERNHGASLASIEAWDFEADLLPIADAIIAAGWRPPLPATARVSLRAVVAGAIGEHTGEEEDHEVAANYAAAQALIDRGWLDPVGQIGPPEPVATTLRRIIRDLEEQAAGPQRHTHAGIALSQYADRLRGHPALKGESSPLPDSETEWGYRVNAVRKACAAEIDRATTPEATQFPTRVIALLADPGAVHEVEADDEGNTGDCIDDCAGCAAERGEATS